MRQRERERERKREGGRERESTDEQDDDGSELFIAFSPFFVVRSAKDYFYYSSRLTH